MVVGVAEWYHLPHTNIMSEAHNVYAFFRSLGVRPSCDISFLLLNGFESTFGWMVKQFAKVELNWQKLVVFVIMTNYIENCEDKFNCYTK